MKGTKLFPNQHSEDAGGVFFACYVKMFSLNLGSESVKMFGESWPSLAFQLNEEHEHLFSCSLAANNSQAL